MSNDFKQFFNFMRKLTLIISLFLSSFLLFSQNEYKTGYFIKGAIIDSLSDKPVEYATVGVYSAKDSSLVGGVITDAKGLFNIKINKAGSYYLQIKFMGYATKKVGPFEIKNSFLDFGRIYISQSAQSLSGVSIVAEKPLIELNIDKKVVNVSQNLNTTGGTALDVLKEVPSVEVDPDGNVSLRGSESVTILIDGRPSTLTGSDQRSAMEQIAASSIESVELITNPSAKYKPDGMTGIINIVLKKKKGTGLNTLLTLNAGTKNKYSGSFSASYSTDKYTIFGSYNYQNRSRTSSRTNKTTSYNLIDNYYLQQDASDTRKHVSNNIKIGGEYYFSKKLIASFSASIFMMNSNSDENTLSFTQNPDEAYTSIFRNTTDENFKMDSWQANFNLKKRFNKPKHEIDFDFSLNNNVSETNDFIYKNYLESDFITIKPTITPENSKTLGPRDNKIYTLKIDYVYPINDSTKLEAGFDGSIREIDTDNKYYNYNFSSSEWALDNLISNHFLYNENIGALYVNYSTKIKRWGLSLGSRFEQAMTNAKEADSTDNIKKYYSWFPTGALSYKLSKNQEIQLTYSKRINRPRSRDLNPYVDYSSYPNLRGGNPFLNPEYVHALELSYAWYSKLGTIMPSIFYRNINDVISRYRQRLNDSIFMMTPRNYSSATSYGFELIYSFKPLKWWNSNISGSWYKQEIDGSNVEANISASGFGWQVRNNNSFRFKKSWEAQLSFFYNSPRETGQGYRGAMFFSDFALKKSFFKDRLAFSLNIRDLLGNGKFSMHFDEPTYKMDMLRRMEGRVFMFGITWKMSGDYKQQREKNTPQNINGGDDDIF